MYTKEEIDNMNIRLYTTKVVSPDFLKALKGYIEVFGAKYVIDMVDYIHDIGVDEVDAAVNAGRRAYWENQRKSN